MKFIRDLLGKKRNAPQNDRMEPLEQLEQSYRDTIGALDKSAPAVDTEDTALEAPKRMPTRPDALRLAAASRLPEAAEEAPATAEVPSAPAAPVNIWDLEDDGSSPALPEATTELAPPPAPEAPTPAAASAAAARSPARSRRTKTRLIGFEQSDGAVVDLFNDAPAAAPSKSVKFPVGWLVVAEGPGRGESFSLLAGMSQIGRGEDQAVQLDFGDNSISRTNHAAVVYDPSSKEFLLGHGGKSNIVRLNDKPVISNEKMKTGDTIRIGETVLRFVALCDNSFNWSDGATEEDEDVAIA